MVSKARRNAPAQRCRGRLFFPNKQVSSSRLSRHQRRSGRSARTQAVASDSSGPAAYLPLRISGLVPAADRSTGVRAVPGWSISSTNRRLLMADIPKGQTEQGKSRTPTWSSFGA